MLKQPGPWHMVPKGKPGNCSKHTLLPILKFGNVFSHKRASYIKALCFLFKNPNSFFLFIFHLTHRISFTWSSPIVFFKASPLGSCPNSVTKKLKKEMSSGRLCFSYLGNTISSWIEQLQLKVCLNVCLKSTELNVPPYFSGYMETTFSSWS